MISVSVTPLLASNREVGKCGFLGSPSFSHFSQVLLMTHRMARVSVSTPAPHLGISLNADSELGKGEVDGGLPGVLFLLGNSSGDPQINLSLATLAC